MTALVIALSIWLHTLATVVFVGHYFFQSLVYLPVFEHHAQGKALRELLEEVSGRLRPYFGLSLLVFIITGTYLMMINEDYLGLGNFFGNPWSILIVIKHVLVLTFLALAVYSERAFMGHISDENPNALRQFGWAVNINTIQGLVILLLTAFAQAG